MTRTSRPVSGACRIAIAALILCAQSAHAASLEPPALFGIPLDFVLFALTLLGVALFHRHTLYVALAGLATIALYKLAFTGFKTGPGLSGLIAHMQHEWVTGMRQRQNERGK